jgi:hypothetical protein
MSHNKGRRSKIPDFKAQSHNFLPLDTKDLYISLPTKQIINLKKCILTNRDISNNETEIALFRTVFNCYYFSYEEQYYQTSKGVAMGAPTSSVTLEIFLQYYLKATNISMIRGVLVVYRR